jgi:molybdate transport system permease protein
VVLMVGGDLPGVTRTASIDIYDRVQALEYRQANHLALLLLAIAFGVLCLVYAVNRRVWTPAWTRWTVK